LRLSGVVEREALAASVSGCWLANGLKG